MEAFETTSSEGFIFYNENTVSDVNTTGESSSSYTEQVLSSLYICIQLIIIPLLSFVPIVVNIINMVVLYKQGVNNCVNLCLFCLAAADLIAVITALSFITATYLIYFNIRPGIDPLAVYFVSVYATSVFNDIANTLTAFLSFERCLCVVLPLKFKDIITFRRCVVVIIFICFGLHALWIPHYLSYKVTYVQDGPNSTRYLGLYFSSHRLDVDLYLDTVCLLGVTTFNLVVVCVCTQIMIVSLHRSSRFQQRQEKPHSPINIEKQRQERPRSPINIKKQRQERTLSPINITTIAKTDTGNSFTNINGKGGTNCNEELAINTIDKNRSPQVSVGRCKPTTNRSQTNICNKDLEEARRIKPKPSSTSSRNQSVVKIVIRLCIICIACNTVRLTVIASKKIFPEFNFNRNLEQWHQLAVSFVYGMQLANCSLNIVVYYRFNRSFRETLQEVFCKSYLNRTVADVTPVMAK